jgi:hypothetical protein
MSPRLGWLSACLLAFSFVAACAEGAPAAPPGEYPADPTLGAPKAMCGNGMRETGELCDCPPTASTMCEAPEGVTCESLIKGTMGTVYCLPKVCIYITDFCKDPAGNAPGAGMGGGANAGRGG